MPVTCFQRFFVVRPDRLSSGASALVLAMAFAAPVHDARAGDADPCTIPSTSVMLAPQAPDPDASFGASVAIAGEWIAVGVPGVEPDVPGRVELFRRSDASIDDRGGGSKGGDDDLWLPHSTLMPAAGAPGDRFGAALSLDADTLLIGATRATGRAPSSGAVHVFRLSGERWNEEATLVAPDGGSSDNFGTDVALDGDLAVIGAPGHDAAAGNTGAAYVFGRQGTEWTFETKLADPTALSATNFGTSVEISDTTIAVGVPGDPGAKSGLAGSVRIFDRRDETWTQTALLTTEHTVLHEATFFGFALGLRGGTLIASASIGGSPTGAALVFQRAGTASGAASGAAPGTPSAAGGPETSWDPPHLLVAHGSVHTQARSLVVGPSATVATWVGRTLDEPLYGSVIHQDGAGWYVEHRVLPVTTSTGMLPSSYAAAMDEERIVVGRSRSIHARGVIAGAAFVSRVPPRDRDLDGLDDACEIASGSAEECDGDGIIDDAQIPYRYAADVPDLLPTYLTLNGASEVLILNHFAVTGSSGVLRSLGYVRPSIGTVPPTATAVVYLDPNGDGNPDDAVLIRSQTVSIDEVEHVFQDLPIEPVDLGPDGTSFFVGLAFSVTFGDMFATLGEMTPFRPTSWATWTEIGSSDALDLTDLSKHPPTPAGYIEGEGIAPWTIRLRAHLSDCDASDRLDSCEILDGTLIDTSGDGVPDVCEGTSSDLDGDGIVNESDLALLLAAWGPCPIGPASCLADLDGDGVVDATDLGALLAEWTS